MKRHVDPLRFWEPCYAQDFGLHPHHQLLACHRQPYVSCPYSDGQWIEDTRASAVASSDVGNSAAPKLSEPSEPQHRPALLCMDEDGIIEHMAMSSPFDTIVQATTSSELPELIKRADEPSALYFPSGLCLPDESTQSSEALTRSYQLLLVRWIISRAHKATMPLPQGPGQAMFEQSAPYSIARRFSPAANLRMPPPNGRGTKWLRMGHSLYHPANASSCGNQVQSIGIQQSTPGGATAA